MATLLQALVGGLVKLVDASTLGRAIPRIVSTTNGFTVGDNEQVTISQQMRTTASGSGRTYGTGTAKWVN